MSGVWSAVHSLINHAASCHLGQPAHGGHVTTALMMSKQYQINGDVQSDKVVEFLIFQHGSA